MKFKKIKIIIIGLFILGIVRIPSFSFAESQIVLDDGDVSVNLNPNNPQPYQDTIINLESYSTDLNKAIITWQKDSKTIMSGIGKTSYSFTTDGPNTTTSFNIFIKPEGSTDTITKSITIIPSDIEIMWESLNGYTPPFYKGKSLPISGGFIKAVAIPNTNTIKSGNGSISYTWKNNGEVVQGASGYNKNSYIFKNDVFDKTNEISVTASSVGGDYNAETSINISSYNPKIIFYKKSPSEGIFYNTALSNNTNMTGDEMTIIAAPYFLPIKNSGNFSYEWLINDKMIDTPTKKTELTVRPNARGGYATINLVIENLDELFQKVSSSLKLIL